MQPVIVVFLTPISRQFLEFKYRCLRRGALLGDTCSQFSSKLQKGYYEHSRRTSGNHRRAGTER